MELKIAFLIILISVSNILATPSYSQVAKVSLDMDNKSLEQVMDEIESQSEFYFIFNQKQIDVNRIVNIQEENMLITDILPELFKGTNVNYVVFDRKILLTTDPLENNLLAIASGTKPQQKQITGTVSDKDGGPLTGVNVVVTGTTTGAITDIAGKYSIEIPQGSKSLTFTFIGMKPQEIAIGTSTQINVTMAESAIGLDEVVVIGYGTVKKSDLTGATSSVSAAQIEKTQITTLGQSLQGLSAGVQVVNQDASPGSSVNIKIRGTGTFGDNSPLYVVDGYPISEDISQLNSFDIASIAILKDASATAIYGNRASNGVVIITTKRGDKNGLRISVDGQTSVQSQPKFYDVLNVEQFALAAQIVNKTQGFPILPEWNNASSLRNINWQDAFYQTGIRQNYNVALHGGNEKVQTSFSLGYLNQKGIVIFSDFERYNTSINLDYEPAKWLKASTSLKYTRSERQVRFGSSIAQIGTLTRIIPTMTGNPVTDEIKDANGNYGYFTQNAQATVGHSNLIADIEDQDVKNPSNDLLTTFVLEASFLKGFKLKSNLGINIRNAAGYSFTKSNNRSTSVSLAQYTQSANDTYEWLWENTLGYSKTFGVQSIDFVGGISSQENTYLQMSSTGTGYLSNDLRDIGSATTVIPYGNQQTWSLASEFARLSYRFTDRYIVTGTIRRDGSSRFGPGKKWGAFPSLAAAWNISKEPFMANVKFLSNLKLRGSWGKAGNQNIGLFKYGATYTMGSSLIDNRGYVFGTPKVYYPGFVQNNLANANLTWETSIQSDGGIDASFLGNRINLTIDYYDKKSINFLLDVPVPAQTGFTSAAKNVGSIINRGLELSLEYRESAKQFKWSASVNISTLNNKILSFTEGVTSISNFSNALNFQNYGGNVWTVYSQSTIGGNIGAFYGFKTDGIYQTQAEVDADNAGAKAKYGAASFYQTSLTSPGDRRFVDVNGDGRITDDDRQIIGSPIPKMFGGLHFDASYKQFDFSLFIYASYGNEIFNYAKRNLETFDRAAGVGLQNIGVEYYNNYWKPDRPSDTYTRLLAYDQVGNNRPSDAYVEDGSFMRLKNIQIGYNIPAAIANKISSSNIRVFVGGQNLFTFTKYTGLDPEIGDQGGVSGSGIDVGSYPISRYYSLGLHVDF